MITPVACLLCADYSLFATPHGSMKRLMGALAVYVAIEGTLGIRTRDNTDARHTDVAWVPPYVPHQVCGFGNTVATLLIEPELIDVGHTRLFSNDTGAASSLKELADRVKLAIARIETADDQERQELDLELLMFGMRLRRRKIDPRVLGALEIMRASPADRNLASDLAQAHSLSASRLLHLFKQETGFSFRQLRAWKRARTVLQHITAHKSLTQVALESGYPDSAHFTHTVRRTFGTNPRAIRHGLNNSIFMIKARLPTSAVLQRSDCEVTLTGAS
jgi:AraC-like DNA-binding protein